MNQLENKHLERLRNTGTGFESYGAHTETPGMTPNSTTPQRSPAKVPEIWRILLMLSLGMVGLLETWIWVRLL